MKKKEYIKMKKLITIVIGLILLCEFYYAQGGGNALLFDGVDDYVNFGNSSVFNVDTAVTYEMWIRPDTSSAGFLLNKWVGFQEDKQFTYASGTISFYLYNVFGGVPLITGPVVQLNQCTHIAATFNGSSAAVYINGVLDTSKNVGGFPGNSSGNLFMGHNPDRSDAILPFKGVIDEFRIWNRARNESEIQATMNKELTGTEPGLIGYWNFNEGSGSITADQTSNGNDGTISGATWVVSGISLPVEEESVLPNEFKLSQNYPNPFNPSTSIKFGIPENSRVHVDVYSIMGEQVVTLMDEEKQTGYYELEFDASSLSSGIYFYRIQAGSFVQTKKMILIK